MATIHFTGCAHPEGKPEDYDGLYLTKSQMEENAKKMIGAEVRDEHDSNIAIGKITKAFMNENNQLEVEGYVSRETPAGCRVITRMRSGDQTGLSLGMRSVLDHKQFKIVDKSIREVSVVKNPDMEGTFIKHVESDPLDFIENRKFIELSSQVQNLKEKVYKDKTEAKENFKKYAQAKKISMNANKPTDSTQGGAQIQGQTTQQSQVPQQNQNQTQVPNPETNVSNEDLKKLIEQNAQLQKQLEDLNNKADKWRRLKRTPEEIARDEEAKEAKRLKKIEENQKVALDYATKLLQDANKLKPNNAILDAINRAKENPGVGSQLVEILSQAHAAHHNSISQKEKEYQELKARLEAAEAKAREADLKQQELQKRSQYSNMVNSSSGYSGLQPGSLRNDTNTNQISSSPQTNQQAQPMNSNNTSFGERWTGTKPSQPDLSGIMFNDRRITFGVDSSEFVDRAKDVWSFFNSPKSSGMDRVNYLSGREFQPPKHGVNQIGNGLFELLDPSKL